MSRIGKAPIPLPDKVSVSLNGLAVTVKGPKGELSRTLPDGVQISQDGNTLVVSPSSETRRSRERHGLCRTLVANMVEGVSQGYSRKLEIVGVGYRAAVQGKKLVVSAGYSHQVEMVPPDGVTFAVEGNASMPWHVGAKISEEFTEALSRFDAISVYDWRSPSQPNDPDIYELSGRAVVDGPQTNTISVRIVHIASQRMVWSRDYGRVSTSRPGSFWRQDVIRAVATTIASNDGVIAFSIERP